jgi:hypothetical protein
MVPPSTAVASRYTALQLLVRSLWRRRKGGYVRRLIVRITVALYNLQHSPVLNNTSCKALLGAGGLSTSSVPFPP